MKTSVVLATYNGEDFIIEQLDSLQKQTHKIDEVIICDDISNDRTEEIVKDYIKRNNLIGWNIYKNKKNLGYGRNFYNGILKATGDLIFFCDQDDIWELDKVEKMKKVFDNNCNIKLLCSEFTPFYTEENVKKLPKSIIKKMKYDNSVEKINLNSKSIFIGAEGCTMAIKKSFFDEIKKYWDETIAHDEFVWKMALCVDGCYMYHKSTLKRRIHGNNASIKKMHKNNERLIFLNNLLKSHEQMYYFAKDIALNEKYINLILKNIKSVELRINLLKEKRYINTITLISKYFNNYHSRKSILMELFMAITQ